MKVRDLNPLTPVIFATGINSIDKAVELLNMGAFTYLTKPIKVNALLRNIEKALAHMNHVKEDKKVAGRLRIPESIKDYVFESQKIRDILRPALQVAESSSNVLITGESGTGKEVMAHIIHSCSKRKAKPFIKVNLAALPETLMEAELFGACKGAYTGATRDRAGKFEEADTGTLFLDEIGELAPAVQVKLLRVIQEREITRLGSNASIPVDIRLVTATNKDLEKLIAAGTFREDLFYRLNVFKLEMPPLRERKKDIPSLVKGFINKFNRREEKRIIGISKDALNALVKYRFPGNVRELENIVERAVVLAQGEQLGLDQLPVFIGSGKPPAVNTGGGEGPAAVDASLALPDQLAAFERNIVETALKKNYYNQTRTAETLGISESRLRYRIRTLGIKKGD
ncbi:MAG: sigma-54-dependent Fis family transcriptional regulator [bacterium]|nr:sigma-54-dependent Fis family transcriptional regulator [bacterium]